MSARPRGSGLVRRPPRAIPTVLLAAALLLLGALGIWLLGTYLIYDTWPPAATPSVETIAETTLGSVAVRIVAVVLALVGCALLLAALIPGRPSRVQILPDDIPGETAISRRDLALHVERRTETVDGVHSAGATIGPRRVDVTAQTVVEDPAPVAHAAREAVDRVLAELQPTGLRRSRVRIGRRS